jgi:hypothetical protein
MSNALKMHLRVLDIHRTTLRVVTLRPSTPVRFSTNYFHGTWHILGDPGAASILARLLWGLAYQTCPGTVVLIDRDHLVPTPFEADPPDPILLVRDGLARADVDTLRALAHRLRRPPAPTTTIRWHTFGMPAAIAADDRPRGRPRRNDRERMSRRGGFVCYTAPRDVLRSTALAVHDMSTRPAGYLPLGEGGRWGWWYADGEVQVIERFASSVRAAKVARRNVLGDAPRPIASDEERWAIYRRRDALLAPIEGGTKPA